MPIFQYLTFPCSQPELQALLTRYGLERWRLHTCDVIPTIGQYGSGIPQILVVMDRVVEEPDEQVALADGVSEGIAMRG